MSMFYENMHIPEQGLDPPKHSCVVVGKCFYCGEDIYEGEDIYIDMEQNMIHHDCQSEDSKRFYPYSGIAENVISHLQYKFGRDFI